MRPSTVVVGSFDAEAFYVALNQTRLARELSWKKVAAQSGVSAATLTRMAQGRRPDIDGLAALTVWSGLRCDDFVRSTAERSTPSTLAIISTYLRADENLSPRAAEAMERIIATTYQAMCEAKPDG